ncbi:MULTISPECIES: 30S ribosomal protein S3 [unclassified Candidatus Tisiphia]|uniref:30S ribosomal protein S3 n=1 Tax=unclassified Candidatus Tisiphia TaxID=2996318 RepID=UPI00312C7B79
MGQKVNPHGFRVGPTLIKGWDSVLYADKKHYKVLLIQDLEVRNLVNKNYVQAQVSRVLIERPSNKNVIINIFAKKPGVIIGKSGNDIDKLKKSVQKITGLEEIYINIHEVKKPNIDSNIIAQTIAMQLEKRVSFRKAMKTAIQACFKQGGLGIKVACSGRLAGAEIARTEWYREGRVPLHTLRADIDYATAEAMTTYGVIGIKVWVYRGDHVENRKKHN